MEKQWLVSPLRQCSSTPVSFGQEFLSKQCDDTGESPVLSWPGSTWILPVSLTEIIIEGMELCAATVIFKNVTEELKRLS